ncbi:MAG: hypothetical protein AAGC70_18970 [Pseudomonadota bacterium]
MQCERQHLVGITQQTCFRGDSVISFWAADMQGKADSKYDQFSQGTRMFQNMLKADEGYPDQAR